MATFNNDLVTNFLVGTDQLSGRLNTMKNQMKNFDNQLAKAKGLVTRNLELNKIGAVMNNNGKIIDQSTKKYLKQSEVIRKLGQIHYKKLNEQQEMAAKKAKILKNRFDMNTLSWVFAGMALQRLGLMAMRFLIPSMDKLEKINSKASKKVMGVAAAFEFLKVSLFETLASTPLFQEFVEWIVKAAIWVAELTQQNPWLVETAAIIGGLATFLGTIAMGVGIFKQLAHLGKLIKNMFGVTGTGGEAGTAVAGFSKAFNKIGMGLAVGEVAIGLTMMTAAINKGDFGGALGYAIGSALGIGAAVAFFVGSGPVGWTLLIAGGIVLAATYLTTDTRSIRQAGRKLRGENSNLLNSFDDLVVGVGVALGGGDPKYEEYSTAMSAVSKYNYLIEELTDAEKYLNNAREIGSESLISQGLSRRNEIIAEMNLIKQNVGIIDEQFAHQIQVMDEMRSIKEEDRRITEIAKQADIERYTSAFTEQLKSKELTDDMIENAEKFGEIIEEVFGDEDKGVIGKFNALGKGIVLDNEYFMDLRNDIEEWASTETVKTVRVKYIHEGSGGAGEDGFFERLGRGTDELVSSITEGRR